MVERQSPEQLIASHEQLSKLVGQREAFTKRLGADSIDFENTTPREVRIFGIRNRVRASIDRLKDSLTAVDSQLDEYLPQIARDYRSELIRKERDLRSIERSGLAVPEETLTGFRSQLQQFRDKPQSDPVLAKALGIKMEQKAPPAPPAELPASAAEPQAQDENEKRRIEALKKAILFKMGNSDNFIIPSSDPKIEELNLSARSYNPIKRYSAKRYSAVNLVRELLNLDAEELRSIRLIGKRNLNEILEALIKFGVSVKPETPATPPVETPLAPEQEKEKPIVAPVKYTFDPETKTLQIGEKTRQLTPVEYVFIQELYDHIGIALTSSQLQEFLANKGIKSSPSMIARTLEKNLGQKLLTRIKRGGGDVKWALGINPPRPEADRKGLTQITFNPINGEFTKDGVVIPKLPKYFGAIIRYLAENPGRHPATDLFQVLKDAGSRVKKENTTAYIGAMEATASEQGLGGLIQKDAQVIQSVKNGHFINYYSLSPESAVNIREEISEEEKQRITLEQLLKQRPQIEQLIRQEVLDPSELEKMDLEIVKLVLRLNPLIQPELDHLEGYQFMQDRLNDIFNQIDKQHKVGWDRMDLMIHFQIPGEILDSLAKERLIPNTKVAILKPAEIAKIVFIRRYGITDPKQASKVGMLIKNMAQERYKDTGAK